MKHDVMCPVAKGPCHSVGGSDPYHDVTPLGGRCSCGKECECAKIDKIRKAAPKTRATKANENKIDALQRRVKQLENELASLQTVMAAIHYDGDIEALIEVTQRADAQARATGYANAYEDCSAAVRPLEDTVQRVATALNNAVGYFTDDYIDLDVLDRKLAKWAKTLNSAVDNERVTRTDLISYNKDGN